MVRAAPALGRLCPNRPSGVTITDLDGNRFYDLTGSYGINVLGYDFYKEASIAAVRACVSLARCSAPIIR